MIDLVPGYVLIIPRNGEDQHALYQALMEAAEPHEGVGTTTATPVLSFIVPQALADRVGRGASDQAPAPPDDSSSQGESDADAPGDAAPPADTGDAASEDPAAGDDGSSSGAGRSASRRGKKTDSAPTDADPASGEPTQEG